MLSRANHVFGIDPILAVRHQVVVDHVHAEHVKRVQVPASDGTWSGKSADRAHDCNADFKWLRGCVCYIIIIVVVVVAAAAAVMFFWGCDACY